jgi:Flp pilus assembly protein TadG
MTSTIRGQHGAALVEFALVSVLFLTLLMAIVEFGRWLSTLELVSEATRRGARMAVVCDINDTTIRQRMQSYLPMLGLADEQIAIAYFPAGCTKSNCQSVSVKISGATFTPAIPFLMAAFPVPPFATSLPRESMESTNDAGEVNPVCN